MNNFVAQNDMEEFSPIFTGLEESSSLLSTSPKLAVATPVPAVSSPSYQPYPWSLANQILDLIDVKTNGHAGQVQRVFSYLLFGGMAALVNLVVFFLMYHFVLPTLDPAWMRNTLSYIVAAECSIVANFIPNDRFTFNTLPGAKRPWLQRCMRFHMTCIVGSGLTFLIEFALSTFTRTEPVVAEAIATLIVLIYNFSFHHIFTYRRIRRA